MIASLLLLSATVTLDSHLPPLLPWQGKSIQLMQDNGPLTTDFELSEGLNSPNYEQTMAFVDRLVAANPTQFQVQTIAKSNAGREIKMLVASEDGLFSAEQLINNSKPTIFIQAYSSIYSVPNAKKILKIKVCHSASMKVGCPLPMQLIF